MTDLGLDVGDAHPQCMKAGHHVCQQPSGRACAAAGCAEPAGTWWGPGWCPVHDKERIDRISKYLDELMEEFGL